jgi:hypothetical protein
MQREERSGAIVRSGGTAAWQAATAKAQRGAKRQPAGRACGGGTTPGMAASRAAWPSGTLAMSAAV